MVEDLLAERGIMVSHQTVRLWAEKFGTHFATEIRKRSAGRLGDKWHLDVGCSVWMAPVWQCDFGRCLSFAGRAQSYLRPIYAARDDRWP